MAAFPSLGTLKTSVTNYRRGTQQDGGPYLCRRWPRVQQEGARCLLLTGSILSLKLLQTGPTSQARVQLLCPALLPRGRCAWDQPLQGRQGQGSQDKVARGGVNSRLLNCPLCPSLNNLRVKLCLVAPWSQGRRSLFLFYRVSLRLQSNPTRVPWRSGTMSFISFLLFHLWSISCAYSLWLL